MGNVARQSILSTISAYVGVGLGYLNVVIFMPKFMSVEEIGLFRTIIAIAMILVPLCLFGSTASIIRFHPKYKKQSSELMGLQALLVLLATFLTVVLSYVFQDHLFRIFEKNAARVNDYFDLIYLLLVLMVIYNLFQTISRSYKNIVFPNILTDLVYKSFHASIIVLVGYSILSFHQYLYSHVVIYILLCVSIAWFAFEKFELSFSFKHVFSASFVKEVLNFNSFSFLGGFGVLLVYQVDQIMVSQMLGLTENGIYSTALFIGMVIDMPKKYVNQIMGPYISEDLDRNDLKKVNEGFKESSNLLLWASGFIFIVITTNLDNIFAIMPNGKEFATGFWVVYIIGLTRIISASVGVSGEIISISRYYKVNVFLIFLLGVMTVFTNLLFIPIFGMEGAAFATLLTVVIFNFLKLGLLYWKFKLNPFILKSAGILVSLVIVYFLVQAIPTNNNVWIDLFIRSMAVGILMIMSIFVVRPSEQVIILINKLKNRIT